MLTRSRRRPAPEAAKAHDVEVQSSLNERQARELLASGPLTPPPTATNAPEEDDSSSEDCVRIRSVAKGVYAAAAVHRQPDGAGAHIKAKKAKGSAHVNLIAAGRDLVAQVDALGSVTRDFCEHWSAHNDGLDTIAMRTRVVKDMLDRVNLPARFTFSTADFPLKELTLDRLVALYRVIDQHFFNLSLDRALQRLAKEQGFRRGFEFVLRDRISDEPRTTMFYEQQVNTDHPDENFVGIVCHAAMWDDRARRRQVDGIPSPSKLFALTSTMTHEIVHALAHLLCSNAEHDQEFRSMNRALFGASAMTHTSVDY